MVSGEIVEIYYQNLQSVPEAISVEKAFCVLQQNKFGYSHAIVYCSIICFFILWSKVHSSH